MKTLFLVSSVLLAVVFIDVALVAATPNSGPHPPPQCKQNDSVCHFNKTISGNLSTCGQPNNPNKQPTHFQSFRSDFIKCIKHPTVNCLGTLKRKVSTFLSRCPRRVRRQINTDLGRLIGDINHGKMTG